MLKVLASQFIRTLLEYSNKIFIGNVLKNLLEILNLEATFKVQI